MTKPKKWIEATAIDQITAGARVRFTHYESAPVEFTALAVNTGVVWAPTEHSFNFDREGRTWYVRNPEWTKPKKIDGLHEGHSAKHWHRRWGISVEYNKTLAATIRELEARIAELEAAPAPEPVMPDEPPIGSFFRVDRTGEERIMTLHQLKIEPKWLDRLLDGSKTAEVRRHDRDFQVGDHIEFLEWSQDAYGPRSATAVISHVLPGQQVYGVDHHYCVLSLCEIQKVGK